jgi:hypothetical protein
MSLILISGVAVVYDSVLNKFKISSRFDAFGNSIAGTLTFWIGLTSG